MKRLTARLDGEDELLTFYFPSSRSHLFMHRSCKVREKLRGSCESESGGHGPGLMDPQWRCEDAKLHIIAMPIILAINRAVVLST